MATVVVRNLNPVLQRLPALLWGLFYLPLRLKNAGADQVILYGRPHTVLPRPLGVARQLVPLLLRCSQRFAEGEVTEALYDDLILILSLGLGVKARYVESFPISISDLARIYELIARVNGLSREEGTALGGVAALAILTGMSSMPGSSAPPAGPGTTSIGN